MPDPSNPTRTNLGGAAGTPGSSFPSIEEGRFPAGTMATYVWILRRFGLLSLAATVFTSLAIQSVPLVAASWYAARALTTPAIFTALAAWALYVILTSRPGTASRAAAES